MNTPNSGGSSGSRSNLPLGQKLRDLAIEAARLGANPEWKLEALLSVGRTAQEGDEFIVDDVVARISKEVSTRDLRALGSVMLCAERLGWISKTEKFLPSRDPKHHACPRRVWKSRIFGTRRDA